MTNIEIFNSAEFGSVRIVQEGDRCLFCAFDVARALGYSRPNDAVSRHCRATVKRSSPISGKMQEINFIPEGDVYRLIVHSKLPSAERFERWVFDEVLPSLRKNGIYITDPLVKQFARDPDFAHAVVDALYEQTDRVNELAPKASYFRRLCRPGRCRSPYASPPSSSAYPNTGSCGCSSAAVCSTAATGGSCRMRTGAFAECLRSRSAAHS